jgi:hypothetical protein
MVMANTPKTPDPILFGTLVSLAVAIVGVIV